MAPALALIAGAALAPLCPSFFAPALLSLAALACGLALALRCPGFILLALILWPLAWSALTRRPPLRLAPDARALIEARVLAVDRAGESGGRLSIDVERCDGRVCRGRFLLYTRDAGRWTAGERLRARVRFLARARRPSLGAVASPALISSSPLARGRRWLRGRLRRGLRGVDGEAAGFLESILLGARERLSPRVRGLLRRTGTGHLLSVSGLHVGLVAGGLLLLLRLTPLTPRPRAVVALLGVASYVVLTGARPASVRAGVLLSGVLGAGLLRRFYDPWNLLALGAGLLVLGEPERVFDPGCQLSFVIVAALIAASGPVSRWLRPSRSGPKAAVFAWVLRSFAVATVAFAAGAPVALARFGQVAPMGPLANPPALPIFAALLALALLGLVLTLIAPVCGAPFLKAAGALTGLLFHLLEQVDAAGPGLLGAAEGSLLRSPFFLGALALAGVLTLSGRRRCGGACGLLAILILARSFLGGAAVDDGPGLALSSGPRSRVARGASFEEPGDAAVDLGLGLEMRVTRGRCELFSGGRRLGRVEGASGSLGGARWRQLAAGAHRLEVGGLEVVILKGASSARGLRIRRAPVLVLGGRPLAKSAFERLLARVEPGQVFVPPGWPVVEGPWTLWRQGEHRVALWPWLEVRSPPARDRMAAARRSLAAWWRG